MYKNRQLLEESESAFKQCFCESEAGQLIARIPQEKRRGIVPTYVSNDSKVTKLASKKAAADALYDTDAVIVIFKGGEYVDTLTPGTVSRSSVGKSIGTADEFYAVDPGTGKEKRGQRGKERFSSSIEKDKDALVKMVKFFNKKAEGRILYLDMDKEGRTFQMKMRVDDDFMDKEPYEKGNAYIYPSKKLYDYIEKLADKLGYEIMWNNTRTTGWFGRRSK